MEEISYTHVLVRIMGVRNASVLENFACVLSWGCPKEKRETKLQTKPHGIDRRGSKEIASKSMKLRYEVLLKMISNVKHSCLTFYLFLELNLLLKA